MKPRIYIPTRGRELLQKTVWSMPESLYSRVIVLSHHGEKPELPSQVQVVELDESIDRWYKILSYLIHLYDGSDFFYVMDDDLRFSMTKDGTLVNINKQEQVNTIFEILDGWLTRGYPSVGVTRRASMGSVGAKSLFSVTCSRQIHLYGWDRTRLLSQNIDPINSDARTMSDFYILLSLLTRGFPNRVLYSHQLDQWRGSDAPGGANIYRTSDEQKLAAISLHQSFPDFVRIEQKKGWNKDNYRWDVTIQWKKAYESALVKSGLSIDPEYL